MKRYKLLIGFILLGLFCLPYLKADQKTDELYTRRFAFLVGANHGGEDRVTLRYAIDDAKEVQKVLEEMGGILPDDSCFLANPSREVFFKEIKTLAEDVKQAKKNFRRVEVIFYYSGHSDEENLFLGRERVSYLEFKDLITSLGADVRIGILDSCASGALTLPKGVIKKPPFLMDTAYDMKGYAFITSSSATEAAQESSRLKRSFFTHNLISGMRGAADRNQDGRITLNEAYQFAFDGTLNQTEKTMAGPQHPSYHIEMSGTGDVVITEIWKSTAVLVLKKDVAGKIYIHNKDNVLVVELNKMAGQEISIGLDSGPYRIISIDDSAIWEATVSLESGKSSELVQAKFSQADKIPTQLRGNLPVSIPEPKARRASRWRIEISGGFSSINPGDLNLRATFDDLYDTFYGEDYFQYQVQQGEIDSFVKTNDGGKAHLLRHSIPVGIRLRYGITNWFDISFGFNYFTSARESNYKNTFEVFELEGSPALYSDEFLSYTLSAKGYVPSVGIHLGKRITPSLRLEGFLTGGPLFAECSYYLDWSSGWPVVDSSGDFGNLKEGFLEEKGRGSGLALQVGAKLDYDFAKHYGLFVEGGYAYQAVSEISGPGIRSMTSHRETWEGDWGIKQDIRERPWGTASFLWPSNAWVVSQGTWWRARDFELNLSGFQVRLGIYFRF
ncbi:MAG: caspase family protein [Candidatus Aminicenantes bacterium]|nr:MAG: caspase family protein [Candidatus Aminicenantes bacterium]